MEKLDHSYPKLYWFTFIAFIYIILAITQPKWLVKETGHGFADVLHLK